MKIIFHDFLEFSRIRMKTEWIITLRSHIQDARAPLGLDQMVVTIDEAV